MGLAISYAKELAGEAVLSEGAVMDAQNHIQLVLQEDEKFMKTLNAQFNVVPNFGSEEYYRALKTKRLRKILCEALDRNRKKILQWKP